MIRRSAAGASHLSCPRYGDDVRAGFQPRRESLRDGLPCVYEKMGCSRRTGLGAGSERGTHVSGWPRYRWAPLQSLHVGENAVRRRMEHEEVGDLARGFCALGEASIGLPYATGRETMAQANHLNDIPACHSLVTISPDFRGRRGQWSGVGPALDLAQPTVAHRRCYRSAPPGAIYVLGGWDPDMNTS
jgi:hypothetical protein